MAHSGVAIDFLTVKKKFQFIEQGMSVRSLFSLISFLTVSRSSVAWHPEDVNKLSRGEACDYCDSEGVRTEK
jgi:hypothetical protein